MRVDADDYARPSSLGDDFPGNMEEIIIEEDAIEKLEEEMSEGFLKECISPLLICDTDAYELTEEVMEEIYDRCQYLILDAEDLEADGYALEVIENNMEDDIDLILAVGDEVIHEISRCIAEKYKIPFVSVPAVENAGGFASMQAYIKPENLKRKEPAPVCVYADSRIFAEEPAEHRGRKKHL